MNEGLRQQIAAFRAAHPEGFIQSHQVSASAGYHTFRVTIYASQGTLLADAHGSVLIGAKQNSGDVMLAEELAMSRSLTVAGFDSDGPLPQPAPANGSNYVDDVEESEPEDDSLEAFVDQVKDDLDAEVQDAKFTKATAEVFSAKWTGQGYKPAQILKVLGVKKLSDWTGTKREADALVMAWIEAGAK